MFTLCYVMLNNIASISTSTIDFKNASLSDKNIKYGCFLLQMDSLSMSDGGLSDQYHDCRSQPSSPRPHTGEECQAQNASREATPALSGQLKINQILFCAQMTLHIVQFN